jgi:hypothetical protein
MATSLQIYESQVIQFLQSCTIIFSPIAAQQNAVLTAAGYVVNTNDPTTWKYYLNLSGQYHASDTVMTIQSLDTKTTVNFTPAMLESNPKTAAAYTIGSTYYNALCQNYPTQVDLIKSILYPVDMEEAIDAEDFTLLGWGEGYLESDEEEAIINELNSFIVYAASSWYFPFLSYEVYYVWTFWASLWQTLPNAIFAARLKYLHTSYVHSFHIWNYLTSKGIGDYSDILTRQQALFLYRNINYLIENRGTQSNLIILVNNLLDSISVGLVGKTIYMNTATNAATCQWTPEFVSTIVPTNNSQSLVIIPPESMTQINEELVNAGLEVNDTTDYIDQMQTTIGNTTLNILPTKLLEIQKLGIDQKYGSILINFILDTLVSMIVTGRYTAELDITDPTTGTNISISPQDALALYWYTIQRPIALKDTNATARLQPTLLPTLYTPMCAFRYDVTVNSFPESFTFEGYSYPTQSYLDINSIVDGIVYPTSPINDPNEFSELVSNLFLSLIQDIRFSRTTGDLVTLKMFLAYMYDYVLQRTPYNFTLSTNADYASWAQNLGLSKMLASLDAQTDYEDAYNNLNTAICSALVPWNTDVFAFFGYTPQSTDDIYDRLKTLFEQLCSYNIAFLDTSRVSTWWFLEERIVPYIEGITDAFDLYAPAGLTPAPLSSADSNSWDDDIVDLEVKTSSTSSVTETIIENIIATIGPEAETVTVPNSPAQRAKTGYKNDGTVITNRMILPFALVSSTTNISS